MTRNFMKTCCNVHQGKSPQRTLKIKQNYKAFLNHWNIPNTPRCLLMTSCHFISNPLRWYTVTGYYCILSSFLDHMCIIVKLYSLEAKSRKYQGMFQVQSPEQSRQVWEKDWSQQVEHNMQIQNKMRNINTILSFVCSLALFFLLYFILHFFKYLIRKTVKVVIMNISYVGLYLFSSQYPHLSVCSTAAKDLGWT